MIASYDSTKKTVIAAEGRGATRPSSQGILRAFALSTGGEYRLGAALWALKYGPAQPTKAVKAAAILIALAIDRRPSTDLLNVCTAALAEWLHDQCPKCTGRGRTGAGREIMERRKFACPTCKGAKSIFRPSTTWRAYAEAGALVGNEIPPEPRVERPCGPCAGKGWREVAEKKNSRLRGCITCRGTGKRIWRDKDRARALNMNGHEFAAWKPAYGQALRVLRSSDAETAIRVEVRLGRLPEMGIDFAPVPGENPEITEG